MLSVDNLLTGIYRCGNYFSISDRRGLWYRVCLTESERHTRSRWYPPIPSPGVPREREMDQKAGALYVPSAVKELRPGPQRPRALLQERWSRGRHATRGMPQASQSV